MPTGLISIRTGVVIACILGVFVSPTPTVNTVFGNFLRPISEDFNWLRSSVSAALFVVAITSAITFPIIGRLADQYGSRIIILIGTGAFAASVALVSFTSASYVQFYFHFALVGITGATLGPVVFTKIIAGWFDDNRGLFLGLVGGIGNGAGATLMPIYAQTLIVDYGWRGAYQGIGLVILVIGLPAALLLLRDPPNKTTTIQNDTSSNLSGMTFAQARRTSTFWMMLVAIALGAGCVTAIFTHVVPMLQDRGISSERATAVLTTFAMVTVAWQICVGFLLDRFPKPRIVAPFFLVAVVGVLLFEMTSSFPLLLLSAFFMGIGLGTEYGVLPYFISRYFGLKAYGAISGMMYGTVILTLGTTPMLMDLVFDFTGTYNLAIAVISIGLVACVAIISRLQPFDEVLTKGLEENPST